MTRIAVGGFLHETNTFAPTKATYDAFVHGGGWPAMAHGADVLKTIRNINVGLAGFIDAAEANGWEIVPSVFAAATPCAHVSEDAFERIAKLIVDGIASAGGLDGVYLALATFALAAATPQLLKLSPFEHWTGGVQGIVITKPDAPFGLQMSQDTWLYYFTLAVGLILYILARNLVHSRTGRAMMAIRDNPIAARSMGVNNSLYKAMAFGISAAFTGVAGALGAIIVQFVAPDSFTLVLSIGILVGLVVGGVGWLPGALIGGAFLVYVPNVSESISKGLSGAVYGILLILVIYAMPSGAAGLLRAIVTRFRKAA